MERTKTKKGQDIGEGKTAEARRKAATSSKGRHNQPRGSAKHNTSPKHAKPEKNHSDTKESLKEMMF